MDEPLEFILVPKCPLFGDSTVFGENPSEEVDDDDDGNDNRSSEARPPLII